MATCKKCKAEIEFVPYTNRDGQAKHMPVNPETIEPSEAEAHHIFVDAVSGKCKQAKYIQDNDGGDWRISHFATCPFAEDFRSKR
jgi:hypothetical protein